MDAIPYGFVAELHESDPLEADTYDQGRADLIRSSFQPSAPVKTRDLFSGRNEQMTAILDLVDQAGLHGAVFGERGVGKTSLARIMSEILSKRMYTVRVNCSANDTFQNVWQRVLGELDLYAPQPAPGFEAAPTMRPVDVTQLLPGEAGPDEVRRALSRLVTLLGRQLVVFLDEFDRIANAEVRTAFADTLKALSDQDIDVTLILVGVADNITELVAEHASIERNLAQIHMPRMSQDELRQIVVTGLKKSDIAITDGAMSWITTLSIGLPHYTHLLAQRAALNVIEAPRSDDTITTGDVETAIMGAIDVAQQSVRDAYNTATTSNRSESLYQQVLLACALAKTDDSGFFKAVDVRDPLTGILGRPAQYAQHLKAFSGPGTRGSVLEARGSAWQVRYRFANPLLQPYVLMRGIQDNLIDPAAVVLKPSRF